MKKLQKSYELACNSYVKAFCKKQDMDFNGWIGNSVGGIALCSDFSFNLHDIVWDMNSKQPKGVIIQWYDDCLSKPKKSINYYAYTKGVRII